MNTLLKIGIRNNNSERSRIVYKIFEIVNKKIKDKKGFEYSIEIGDYELLKNQFENYDKGKVLSFEKNQIKALTEFTKNIILFNDSFFNITQIEQESVFMHEIGHVANKPSKYMINKEKNPIIDVYFEYLADKFLFEIDEGVFKLGRIESDLNKISINEIKDVIEKSHHNEDIIKGQFITVIRLSYYYSFYNNESIIDKINSLNTLIGAYFPNFYIVFEKIKSFCSGFNNKTETELYSLSVDIDDEILNLSLSIVN